MKVTDASSYRLLQTNLSRNEFALQELYLQASSGKKLNVASDSPSSIQPVLGARNQITLAERYLETMGVASDKMQSTDSYLNNIENIMQRAKEISINGINDGLSQIDLDTLADEVAELQKQLLDTANTQIDGKYIFAGYSVDSQPFTENPDYDAALYDESDMSTWPVIYNGDNNRMNLEINEGEYLDTTITGNELFLGQQNTEFANRTNGLSGQTITSEGLTPANADDITVQQGDNVITIPQADFIDTGSGNYAGQVKDALEAADAGLRVDVVAAESSTSFPVTGQTTYTLDLDGVNVINIDTSPDDVTIDDITAALGGSSGTFPSPNDTISFETNTKGELIITGADTGAEFSIDENGAGATTVYGNVDITSNSTQDVSLSGAGLSALGLDASVETSLSGSTTVDMFGVLANLEASLRAGNIDDLDGPGGGIQLNMEKLELAADQNRVKRSQLGVKAKRVDDSITQQEGALVDLQATLSRYEDADITEVLSNITKQETALQANLAIISRVSSLTILDYM